MNFLSASRYSIYNLLKLDAFYLLFWSSILRVRNFFFFLTYGDYSFSHNLKNAIILHSRFLAWTLKGKLENRQFSRSKDFTFTFKTRKSSLAKLIFIGEQKNTFITVASHLSSFCRTETCGQLKNAYCIFPSCLGEGEDTISMYQFQGSTAKELVKGKIWYKEAFWQRGKR